MSVSVSLAGACGGSSITPDTRSTGMAGTSDVTGCVEGDTRECVGPGACEGGQVCRNRTWSSCDCGDPGSGGALGTGSGPVTAAGEGGGLPAGTGGDGATTVDEIDWQDDPCMDDGLTTTFRTIDCAGDCPGFHPMPNELECTTKAKCELHGLLIQGESSAESPTYFLHRTPRAEMVDGPCECSTGAPIFAKYRITLDFKDEPTRRVSVRKPWHLSTDATATCVGETLQCLHGSGRWSVELWTESEAAPAVNVKLEIGACE
jgi:hypothetical protein